MRRQGAESDVVQCRIRVSGEHRSATRPDDSCEGRDRGAVLRRGHFSRCRLDVCLHDLDAVQGARIPPAWVGVRRAAKRAEKYPLMIGQSVR